MVGRFSAGLAAALVAAVPALAQTPSEIGITRGYPNSTSCLFPASGRCIPAGTINELLGVYYSSPQGVANAGAISPLPHFRAALAAAKAGVRNANIAVVTDSTGFLIVGAGGNQRAVTSWPAVLSQQITRLTGIPSNVENTWGSNYPPYTGLLTNDSRLALSGSMTYNGLTPSVGGGMYSASAAGSISFTPSVPIDTCDVRAFAGGWSFSHSWDGAAATTHVDANNNSIQKYTLSTTLGTHTLTLSWVSGYFYLTGIDCYTAAAKQVSVWNWAWGGSTTASWAQSTYPWFPLPTITTLAPDLVIIDLGINDDPGIPLATYSANLQAIVDAAKAGGADVVIKTFIPSAISSRPMSAQQSYAAAATQIATANGLPVIDIFSRWGTYESQQPLGFYSDALHGTAAGYADEGMTMARALLALVQ